jgi:hypothetical protein
LWDPVQDNKKSREISTSNFYPSERKELTTCVILTNGQRNETSSVSKCACLAASDVVHTVKRIRGSVAFLQAEVCGLLNMSPGEFMCLGVNAEYYLCFYGMLFIPLCIDLGHHQGL